MNKNFAAFARIFGNASYQQFNNSIVVVDQCHIMAAIFRNHPEIDRLLRAKFGMEMNLSRNYPSWRTIGEPVVVDIKFLVNALELFSSLGWESVVLRACHGVPNQLGSRRRVHEPGDTPLEILPWKPSPMNDINDYPDPPDMRMFVAPLNPHYSEDWREQYQAIMDNDLPDWVLEGNGTLAYLASWFERMDKQ